jgi:hypothetical protein
LDERLYEIARSGPPEGFRISLPKLHSRIGSTQALKHLKAELAEFAAHRKSLPDYGIALSNSFEKGLPDRMAPKRPRRIPLGSWMVAFFPTTAVRKLVPISSLLIVEDGEAEAAA